MRHIFVLGSDTTTLTHMEEFEGLLEATAEALGCTLVHARFIRDNLYGDGLIRCYELTLEQPDGERVTQVVYLQSSPTRVTTEGILVFHDEQTGDEVAVWLYPADPDLPALPVAVYPDAAATLLTRMGIATHGVELRLVAYRPGRRAVVRVRSADDTVWLKVVRPKTISALNALYTLWQASGVPVPQTLGWSDEGIIGFAHLTGTAATSAVTELGNEFLDSVDALVSAYSAIESIRPARTSLVERRDWYARKASAMHPDLAETIASLTQTIGEIFEAAQPATPVTIHGDLHLGQLFVDADDPTQITGLLDIDTAGHGDPADDAAAMYAHLIVSEHFDEGSRAEAYGRLARAWLQRTLDARTTPNLHSASNAGFADRFRAIAATHLIAHSLGGLVPARPLIEHARRLLSER